MPKKSSRAVIANMNKADLYSSSEREYFIESMHGAYPAGVYGYIAGFDELDRAVARAKLLEKSSPGQIRVVNKRREVVFPAAAAVA